MHYAANCSCICKKLCEMGFIFFFFITLRGLLNRQRSTCLWRGVETHFILITNKT